VPTAATKRRTRPPGRPAAAPTRALILDTAERLFAAHGVDGVAVRDLAHEMGITASSLYNHFRGKQALYEAVLERGLGPIIETVAVAWQDGLRPDRVHATLDALTRHLADHPHLAPLLQRALLEESATVQGLVERWVGALYREGIAVVGRAARAAGWETDEVPHLGVALFGMIFAYFTNAAALGRLAGWKGDPLSERSVAVERRFLEKATIRLLGPRPRGVPTRRLTDGRTRPHHR
jgi:AcrR family transcriptional regulator